MLLEQGSRDVVVVAGLPGAGKTTLAAAEPRALDSEHVRAAWAPRLRRIPYPLWRPIAHAWHWVLLWRALGRPEGVVVVRPFTAGWMRRAVLRRARRHHPLVHLVVVAATPAQARAGQAERGRVVGERAMRRHERRWAAADLAAEGWASVLVAARSQATPSPLSADSRTPGRASGAHQPTSRPRTARARSCSSTRTSRRRRSRPTRPPRPSPRTCTAIRPAINGTTSTSSRPPAAAPSSTRLAATAPRAIIDELRRDARMSNVDLADRVSLSPSACLRRVRALEQAGVIRAYRAEIDPAADGRGFEVEVMIELAHKDRATVEAFERRIAVMDPVVACRRMFGGPTTSSASPSQTRPPRSRADLPDRQGNLADLDLPPTVDRMDEIFDVIVVGGGAAGLSGALNLARARRRVLVVDAGEQRNLPAEGVHGLLARDGLPPGELVRLGREEVERYGGAVLEARVAALGGAAGEFAVTLEDGRALTARRLLVTTGLVDELPAVPGVRELWGSDVVHCPYCHGWEIRDRPLGVLGTNHMAVHGAQLFRQWSDDLTLFLHTAPEPTAEEREGLAARGIRVVEGEVAALETEGGRLTGVRMASGEVVPRRALAVAPRFVARSELLAGLGLEPTEHPSGTGERIEGDALGLTAVPGVWVAGNVADPMAWVASAANAGAMAGAAINNDLIAEETRSAVALRAAA